MASSNLLISTPRPSLAPNSYTHSGRGGAGNTYRVSASASSSTPASSPVSSSSARRFFHSGIGGAGNVHAAADRPPAGLNLDEEIARARARERSGVGRSGIGGAGNIFRRKKDVVETPPAEEEKERRGSQWSLSSLESVLKPVKG
ncbi:hypothetical protein F5X68DRAFT_196273 [Plectosphaerella plurivora]|uniref:Uncharacterized protein n=1 Tax=Plectosphaerella plurivora TaxID=936078 RepID=A0A9P8VM02_9PEZI|nr:hypothetical protein F5X68DRAFT_196273 [Plectosphaerella plurivora]